MHSLPRTKLEAVNEWNARRSELQMALGDDIFVPTVSLYEDSASPGRVLTGVTWAHAVPIALPQVEEILLVAVRSARRVPWRVVAPLVANYPLYDTSNVLNIDGVDYSRQLAFRLLSYEKAPPVLQAIGQQAQPDTLILIDVEDVVAT